MNKTRRTDDKLARERRELMTKHSRTEAAATVLDRIAEGLRTDEWSVSFLKDIADLVRTVRDIDRPNTDLKTD